MAEPFHMFLYSVHTYTYLGTVPSRYIIGKPFQSVDYLHHSISTGGGHNFPWTWLVCCEILYI